MSSETAAVSPLQSVAETWAAAPQNCRRSFLSTLLLALTGGGCSSWQEEKAASSSPWDLRPPQMSPDSVVLEIALVRLHAPTSGESTASPPSAESAPRDGSLATGDPKKSSVAKPQAPSDQDSSDPTSSLPESTPAAKVSRAPTPPPDKELDQAADPAPPTADLADAPQGRSSAGNRAEGTVESLVRRAANERADFGDFWQEVDEQFLPTELRRRLAQNGFRCGRLDGRPSAGLQAAIDAETRRRESASPEELTGGSPQGLQRLQNRAGRRGKIVTSELRESLAVLIPEGARLHGKSYSQAQCVVSVRSYPRGDGQIDLDLTPEIEHGQAKQRWLGESTEGSFRLDTSRERLELEQLRIASRLGPGQMIVLGPASPPRGLGRHFFAETSRDRLEPRILVIRLAQTQLDDLFAPERPPQSLATEPT